MSAVMVMNDKETAAELTREIRVIVHGSIKPQEAFEKELTNRGLDDHDALWHMVHKNLFPLQHVALGA